MATGLLDIALSTEEVAGVLVTGVSAKGVAYLLSLFPDLRRVMTGQTVTADMLIAIAPDAVSAIIATGCGYVPIDTVESLERQKEAEAKAANMPLGLQVDFLDAIIRVTMPGGVGPFVAKLEKLQAFGAEGFGKGPDTNSPPPS